MDIDIIYNKIKKNSNRLDSFYRYYSTLVPIMKIDGTFHLLFEIRSSKLRRQPGEISFPGGKRELGESFKKAAIRETMEELNIPQEKIKIIGELPPISTHYNDFIYPFAALLHNITIENMEFNRAEVEQLFTVPIHFFMENPPLEYCIETHPCPSKDFPYHLLPNGRDYKFYKGKYPVYFYKYKNHVIWGLTARTVKNFVDILNK